MTLPRCFCWTRYGTEAGETIEDILGRKEKERSTNGGVFLWGIGNAAGPSIRALLDRTSDPKVAFSPIKSAPRSVDVSPEEIVTWAAGETLDGKRYRLPACSIVTSRFHQYRQTHYALVCFSSRELRIGKIETIRFAALRNLVSGRRLGASQVTAVVEQNEVSEGKGSPYLVSMLVELRAPYFVKLDQVK